MKVQVTENAELIKMRATLDQLEAALTIAPVAPLRQHTMPSRTEQEIAQHSEAPAEPDETATNVGVDKRIPDHLFAYYVRLEVAIITRQRKRIEATALI